jgi:hypothetical protein
LGGGGRAGRRGSVGGEDEGWDKSLGSGGGSLAVKNSSGRVIESVALFLVTVDGESKGWSAHDVNNGSSVSVSKLPEGKFWLNVLFAGGTYVDGVDKNFSLMSGESITLAVYADRIE